MGNFNLGQEEVVGSLEWGSVPSPGLKSSLTNNVILNCQTPEHIPQVVWSPEVGKGVTEKHGSPHQRPPIV